MCNIDLMAMQMKQTVLANTKIYIDNKSTICIVKNPVFHSKTKHIKIRHHFIRNSNEKKLIQMIKIHTNQNVADLLTKAFDATAKAKTVNGEVQLQALVDGKKVIITETSVRRVLKLKDAKGIDCLPNATIFEQLTLMGKKWVKVYLFLLILITYPLLLNHQHLNPRRKKNQGSQREKIPQSSGPTEPITDETDNVESVPTHSNDLLLSGEDNIKLNELMELCTTLQSRVLSLETTKTTQALEIDSLKRRVKKLEKKKMSRTHGLKRLYKVGLSAKVISSDDEEVTLVDDTTETQVRFNDDLMFDTSVLDKQEVEVEKTLIEIKAAKPKVRGVMIQEPSEFTITTTTTTPAASKPSQDKGKAKMTKTEKPLKKKDQIMYDQEVALNLQAQLQAELEEEERHARQKEKEANIALIES
ncbi:hypothetical protein Tco_0429086 [Tanacetum coccineum]